MPKKAPKASRREESLSRERIIDASIELLDQGGEDALTFRALSERLATGPGAIYWHIANKSDLLTAACDAVLARTLNDLPSAAAPEATVRSLALLLFDTIDTHPWVGSALNRSPGQSPIVRLVEPLGRQIQAMHVPVNEQRAAVWTLLAFILGVSAQNAANGQLAKARGLERDHFLETVSTAWLQLDPEHYPFTRSVATQLRTHDDRADFLAGIDLILAGLNSAPRR